MIHIRIDNESLNSRRQFACGLGPTLPEDDKYIFDSQVGLHHTVNCPGCKPYQQKLGTPISELTGGPMNPKFVSIAKSWGYD